MDVQTMEDMKFIGFSGIIAHSFKTIFTWKKLFTQITLSFILPLTLIFIAHMSISSQYFYQIEQNPFQLLTGAFDSYKSYFNITTSDFPNYFWFKSITIITVTAFSVLSTSTVVYTTASVYTGREVTYMKSLKVVHMVWKRVTMNFLCMLLFLFAYSLIASAAIFVCNSIIMINIGDNSLLMLLYKVVYIYGFLYYSIVWQIASVVSVLESCYGTRAMIKAQDLMDGRRKTALLVSYVLYQFLVCVVFLYVQFVAYDNTGTGMVWRVMIGIVCGILFVMIFLVIVVTETVLYLVCKLYHGETIDPVSLSTYLSSYLNDSGPVFRTGEVIQLGRSSQNQLATQV